MLYPVELQAQSLEERRCGRGRGIRTPDVQLPKLALYQAELYPAVAAIQHYHVPKPEDGTGALQRSQSVFEVNISPRLRNPPTGHFVRSKQDEV